MFFRSCGLVRKLFASSLLRQQFHFNVVCRPTPIFHCPFDRILHLTFQHQSNFATARSNRFFSILSVLRWSSSTSLSAIPTFHCESWCESIDGQLVSAGEAKQRRIAASMKEWISNPCGWWTHLPIPDSKEKGYKTAYGKSKIHPSSGEPRIKYVTLHPSLP